MGWARARVHITLKRVIIITAILVVAGGISFALWTRKAPDVSKLKKQSPGITLKLKTADGKERLFDVGTKNPSWTPIDNVPQNLITAIIQSEDISFYSHHGFDFSEIWDAIKTDIEEMSYVRGASTISMQLVKNLYLTREKSMGRKIKEAYLVVKMEKAISKKRIMELYLNIVEWGPGVYGVKEASAYYFGKTPSELTLDEAAVLAVILPNPVYYNPYKRPKYAEKKKVQILERMLKRGHITEEAFKTALEAPLALKNVAKGAAEAEAWEKGFPDEEDTEETPGTPAKTGDATAPSKEESLENPADAGTAEDQKPQTDNDTGKATEGTAPAQAPAAN
ncbi:MAG: monofunctional biosynthetic peptidoglycan transglycosylase [Deltaproteobacteria bacterium]|nr:monofunctional biosynthetic peptidoglycan transglycosylase [Deltaproteobacteria bacterium]